MPDEEPIECIALVVNRDGKITPEVAKIDSRGGVVLRKGGAKDKAWAPEASDWGSYSYKNGQWNAKPKDYPCILVYPNIAHPIPLRLDLPDVRQPLDRLANPKSLINFLDADHIAKMSRAARGDEAQESLFGKIPKWVWWVGGGALILIVTVVSEGGFGNLVQGLGG